MDTTTVFLFDTKNLRALIAKLLTLSPNFVIEANSQINTSEWAFYATVGLVSSVKHGTQFGYDGNFAVATTLSATTYSVQIVGKNAKLWAERLQTALQLPSSKTAILAMGVGLLSISSVRSTTIGGDAGSEERGQFDMVLSQSTVIKESASFVKTAEIDLTVER